MNIAKALGTPFFIESGELSFSITEEFSKKNWESSFGRQKKWSLIALKGWSTYTVTTVWEIAWADSVLVVLDECSSYRGGCQK